MKQVETRSCLQCGEEISGRIDKKFCSSHCRSAYHYEHGKPKSDSLYVKIDKQLKRNRQILRQYNKGGKVTVRKEVLIAEGFDPNYFTHYWKNGKGQVYLFCYEFGYLASTEHGRSKYVLIQWQQFMEK